MLESFHAACRATGGEEERDGWSVGVMDGWFQFPELHHSNAKNSRSASDRRSSFEDAVITSRRRCRSHAWTPGDLVPRGRIRRPGRRTCSCRGRVAFDLLHGLAGVMGEDAVEALLRPNMYSTVRSTSLAIAAGAAGDLVDHDVGVWQGIAFALCASAEQQWHPIEARDRCCSRTDIAGEELHRVINRQSAVTRAGAVDVDVDVFFGIRIWRKRSWR